MLPMQSDEQSVDPMDSDLLKRESLQRVFAALSGSQLRHESVPVPALSSSQSKSEAVHPLVHLLARISYGPNAESLQRAQSLGFAGTIAEQLQPESIEDQAVDSFVQTNLPTLSWTQAQILQDSSMPGRQFAAAAELVAATLVRQVFSRKQLFERMVEFWSDHFNVHLFQGPIRFFKPIEDRDVIRVHALGRFRDLLGASARSPAMLLYLDNAFNTRAGPNENYARELLELHTLGVDGGYTEDDVKAVARCFTGWTFNPRSDSRESLFVFNRAQHDDGEKFVLGQRIAPGGGVEDGDAVLDILARHPSTAQFVSFKLARRFVSDQPPESLVTRMANVFLATDGDVREVLQELLVSDEFLASADQKLKRPLHWLASTLRSVPVLTGDMLFRVVGPHLQALGQYWFDWPAPNGYPDVAPYWTHTSALLTRWQIGIELADGRYAAAMQVPMIDLLGSARSPAAIVDRLLERVLMRNISAEDRAQMIAFVARGERADRDLDLGSATERARSALGLIIASRYFQFH